MECIICCDDDDKIPILTFCDGETCKSTVCINCYKRGINHIIDDYIKQIANEECEASIKRIAKKHLPTYLSEDCTGMGKQIDYITYDNEIISGKLNSKYELFVIESLNASLDIIHQYAIEDDSMFLLVKNETFDKFKN